jgi:hypothetical protein
MIEHQHPVVKVWNDRRPERRAAAIPPRVDLAARYDAAIRPWLYFFALILALVGLALLLAADPASAAEAPRAQPVTIVRVTGADPLVYVHLKDGRALIVSPPRKAPEITVGPARIDLTSRRLLQNGVSYKIDQVVTPKKPQGKP